MLKKICLFLSVLMFGMGQSYAAVDAALVDKAEKYLNAITGLAGTFVQTANGRQELGQFSMLRPGRVRLDYDNMPVQLISDGQDLYFFDKSLDQITTVPITSTPAGILIRKNVNLTNADINVIETVDYKNSFALKMNLRGQEGLGHMTVVFDKSPVKLNSWTVVDATGATTDVAFRDLREKTNFGKNYFQIQRHKTISTSGGDDYYD
ncbi:MAG: outer membrane lipoprotein carrier protein LolA [Alphaproteobacteria bacterium]|nr:outer membrane lipoprotein carrier protein LolA [Alphaproteobacteria bacterium]MBQ8729324.1 outer membrane lipoprotein carrier protein LolA [Alphaproteobacteria bacterium]